MRATLRRSCDSCAKAKNRCDLRTPHCSRCIKKKSNCVYANEPLTSFSETLGNSRPGVRDDGGVSSTTIRDRKITSMFSESSVGLLNPANADIDPFDSYPPTRLHRPHVQRLMHHFLSSIAFQYYPLDLNMESNPFVISWWPLALEDPALFHVSLQTASLDEESRAQRGFPISELLMIDSVSLVRLKIQDSAVAFQDETLNSVVTLAAIEHGKGNFETSRMHIDGVKRMVNVRGGIEEVKSSSPLTARMVLWVSMLVTGAPQFQTQDDSGFGSGIAPILRWQHASTSPYFQLMTLDDLDVEPAISNILTRLRNIFHQTKSPPLTSTELHDLTCYVAHRLLLPQFSQEISKRSAISECLRYALALYMLVIHGTTYYSHATLANSIVLQLKTHLKALEPGEYVSNQLGIWIISIGMAATIGTMDHQWFIDQACTTAMTVGLHTWENVLGCLESILWVRTEQGEIFRQEWGKLLTAMTR